MWYWNRIQAPEVFSHLLNKSTCVPATVVRIIVKVILAKYMPMVKSTSGNLFSSLITKMNQLHRNYSEGICILSQFISTSCSQYHLS